MKLPTQVASLFLFPLAAASAQQPDEPRAQVPPTAAEVVCDAMPNGTVHAEGPRFVADFEPGKATLAVPSANSGELPRVELSYLGATRQGAALYRDNSAPQLAGKMVSYDHGMVDERYEIGDTGFEQSFRFDARPAGQGDLVIQIAANGNVTSPARAAAHQLLHFAHNGKQAITYGEAIAFDRAGLRVDVQTRYDGNGLIELIVPAKFVDEASYPIVVDPAVGPAFTVDGQQWVDIQPSVAVNPDNGNYLVVWTRVFGSAFQVIRYQLFDQSGAPLTPFRPLTLSGVCTGPDVCAVTTLAEPSFLIVFQEDVASPQNAVDNTIRHGVINASTGIASPVNTNGDLVGNLSYRANSSIVHHLRPTVSGSLDGSYLIAFEALAAGELQPKQVRAARVWLRNGPTNPSVVLANYQTPSVLLYTAPDGYVANVRLPASDYRSAPSSSNPAEDWHSNRVVFDVWWDTPLPGDWDIFSCSIRYTNPPGTSFPSWAFQIVDPAGTVAGASSIGVNESHCDIAMKLDSYEGGSDPTYCVVYMDDRDINARFMDINGVNLAIPEINVDATSDEEMFPAVGAGRNEFTVGYFVADPLATTPEIITDIYAARVLPDGSVPVNRRPVSTPNSYFQFDLEITSVPIPMTASPGGDRTLFAWKEPSGPTGGEMDVNLRFFEPVASSVYPFGSACPGPLGELPNIGTYGGEPNPGNQSFGFTLDNAPANSIAVLVIGNQLATIPLPGAPGCNLYMGLPLLDARATITNATGDATSPIPIPPIVPSGSILAFQWAVYTPGWNTFGWITSQDIDLSWSQF